MTRVRQAQSRVRQAQSRPALGDSEARRQKRWIGGLAALAALLAALLAASAWHGDPRTGYRRYVSPPLPDGTRDTFLYPARLDLVETDAEHGRRGRASTSLGVCFATPHGLLGAVGGLVTRSGQPRLRGFWMRSAWVQLALRNDEEVQTVLTDDPSAFSAFVSEYHTLARDGRYMRAEKVDVGDTGGMDQHRVLVTGRASGERYYLVHLGLGPQGGSDFGGDDAVIARSFRVLPPGAAPPSP